MLVGYNTNIPYKGKVYHVQTEDNGIKNPVIITLLYFKGSIIASKKISYAHHAASPDFREKVRDLMKEQHKTMIKELIRGKHTDGQGSEVQEISTEPERPAQAEKTAKEQTAKSLDDILLEFILKKEEKG